MGLPSSLIDKSLSVEVLHEGGQALYSFRLQIGATLICWLGDPYHLEVRSMLHSWANAGHMAVGVKTCHGMMLHTRRCEGTAEFFDPNATLPSAVDSDRFIRAANHAVSSGLVKARAQSEIDSVAKIRKLRIFLVACKENPTLCTAPTID